MVNIIEAFEIKGIIIIELEQTDYEEARNNLDF